MKNWELRRNDKPQPQRFSSLKSLREWVAQFKLSGRVYHRTKEQGWHWYCSVKEGELT